MNIDDTLIDTDGAEAEKMLFPLVEKHGTKAVLSALRPLFYKTRLNDYQRVENMILKIGRRIDQSTKIRYQS